MTCVRRDDASPHATKRNSKKKTLNFLDRVRSRFGEKFLFEIHLRYPTLKLRSQPTKSAVPLLQRSEIRLSTEFGDNGILVSLSMFPAANAGVGYGACIAHDVF